MPLCNNCTNDTYYTCCRENVTAGSGDCARRHQQAQLDALRATGHSVHIYPRKRLVSIDGFRRIRLVGGVH